MTVHCETTGHPTTLGNTRVTTKISGVINLGQFINPYIDNEQKIIHSSTKPPIKFFEEVHIPTDLKSVLGDLYATVDDYDEPEQSTNIFSDRGIDLFMGRQLLKLIDYLKEYEVINFPETMFFVSANNVSTSNASQKKCECCGLNYYSVGKKYMSKKILNERKDPGRFGVQGLLWPGFDVGFSDLSDKNPIGTGYLFATDKTFNSLTLCSNECAVEYCKKNAVLIYYNDFANGGKLRLLSKYTESINTNLQNDYKYRSSNI